MAQESARRAFASGPAIKYMTTILRFHKHDVTSPEDEQDQEAPCQEYLHHELAPCGPLVLDGHSDAKREGE